MQPTIRKAVIPAAGLGTRLRPVTFAVPKAMLPIVDRADRVLPVVHYILAEAAGAGAEQAAVVVCPAHEALLAEYLAAVRREGCAELPAEIELVIQQEPLGFGHAVLLAADFVGDQPFLLLLGDHVHIAADGRPPCAAQVAAAFARTGGAATVGMQPVGPDELPRVGVARGEPIGRGVFRCADFAEKPDLETARARLATPGLAADRFLAHCGIYAFSPLVFELLAELAARRRPQVGELQLADAQSMLLKRHPREYYLLEIAGRSYDTGTPAGYAAAQAAFRASGATPAPDI